MPRRATKKDKKKNRYLREIRESRRAEVFPELSGPMIDWIRRYHPLICDYLTVHLEGLPELRHWRVAYTALHELLGGVWNQADVAEPAEELLWRAFDPFQYIHEDQPLALALCSLLPVGFSPAAFENHYVGFLHFLGDRGVVDRDQSRALAVLMRGALRGDLSVGAA